MSKPINEPAAAGGKPGEPLRYLWAGRLFRYNLYFMPKSIQEVRQEILDYLSPPPLPRSL